MSFKTILDNFVTVTPDIKPADPAKPVKFSDTPAKPAGVWSESVAARENQTYVELLSAAINNKAQPGPDYLKFMATQATLKVAIPDEHMRFVAAFNVTKAQGVTKQLLLDSAAFYQSVLVEERAHFQSSQETRTATHVGGGTKAIEDLEAKITAQRSQIEARKAEIQKLELECGELAKQRVALEADKNTWAAKISALGADFERVFSRMSGEITANVEKLRGLE